MSIIYTAAKLDNLSKSQPSVTVAVNTSGAGFERMAQFRRSLTEEDKRSRRDRGRRRTVSGVSVNIMQVRSERVRERERSG